MFFVYLKKLVNIFQDLNLSLQQLRLLLSKSATGRCILQLAKQGPYLKLDKNRNKLTEIIIEDELSKSEK